MAKGRRRQLGGVDRLPSGRWRVRIADTPTGARLSIGTFKTKAEAEAEAERAFAAAVTDQQKGAWVAPADGRVALDDYATRWLAARLTTRGEPLRPRVRAGAVPGLSGQPHPADAGLDDAEPAQHRNPSGGGTASFSPVGWVGRRRRSAIACCVQSSTPQSRIGT